MVPTNKNSGISGCELRRCASTEGHSTRSSIASSVALRFLANDSLGAATVRRICDSIFTYTSSALAVTSSIRAHHPGAKSPSPSMVRTVGAMYSLLCLLTPFFLYTADRFNLLRTPTAELWRKLQARYQLQLQASSGAAEASDDKSSDDASLIVFDSSRSINEQQWSM